MVWRGEVRPRGLIFWSLGVAIVCTTPILPVDDGRGEGWAEDDDEGDERTIFR